MVGGNDIQTKVLFLFLGNTFSFKKGSCIISQNSFNVSKSNIVLFFTLIFLNNKDKNVHRFAPGGELLERGKEMLWKLQYSVRDLNYGVLLGI